MIWREIIAAAGLLYLVVGLLIAVLRHNARPLPWPMFVWTILLWPLLWL